MKSLSSRILESTKVGSIAAALITIFVGSISPLIYRILWWEEINPISWWAISLVAIFIAIFIIYFRGTWKRLKEGK